MAQPTSDAVSSLPLELVQLATASLPPSALRSLCGAFSNFGPQRTSDLVTRLIIPVSSLNCWRPRCPGRKDSLSRVTTVTIRSAEQRESHSSDDGIRLVLFFLRTGPTMPHLTRLHLHVTTVVPAVASLRHACPHLTCIQLHELATADLAGEGAGTPRLADLWADLAAMDSLRRLKLSELPLADRRSGLPGIGALRQLHSLSVPNAAVRRSELAQLGAVVKVTLGEILPEGGVGPRVDDLPSLECLNISSCASRSDRAPDLTAVAASRGLTRLKFNRSYKWSLDTFLPLYTGLVVLDSDLQTVSYTLLAAMPLLRELHCDELHMPPVGAKCSMPSLRWVDCGELLCPEGGEPAQSVTRTFPQLSAFRCVGDCGDSGMWPASAEGHLPHLRSLSVPYSCLSLGLAQCTSSVEHLVLDRLYGYPDDTDHPSPVFALRLLGQHLLKVQLCGPDTLDDTSLVAALGGWPRVEEVTMRGARRITNAGLAALSRAPRLRRVTLLGCSGVSGDGVAMLASRWSVEHIEVCRCDNVPAEDVVRIEALLGRPQLSMVYSRVDKNPSKVHGFFTG